ncbi:MAG TPA: serine protease, partial [Candidatus Saccharimonadia bacterium]|nr:serine protease [Candidatus Saccharimonadia bacterium]
MIKSLLLTAFVSVAAFSLSASAAEEPKDAPAPTLVPPSTSHAEDADPFEGIVRIEAQFLNPDYRTPWQGGRPSSGSGTGWLVGKNKFITNAHVVSNSTELTIRTTNDPKPYKARILHIAHDCDLAMLEAEDAKHFENMKPLIIDSVPKLNTEVITVGYPIGGER